MRIGKKRVRVVQPLVAFVFIFFTLAAGHLLMVIINNIDETISREQYSRPVVEGRWFGDESVGVELEHLLSSARQSGGMEEAAVYQEALEEFNETGRVTFFMFPVSGFVLVIMGAMVLLALILLVVSRYTKSNVIQTILGIFSGLLLWTGAVEYGLMTASRVLGIAKTFEVYDGVLIGRFGEYVLLKYSWGFLFLVIFYILFQESVRCNFFLFFRRNLKLMRGPVASGRIDNYAPRVAFMYATVMWFFYVLLLLAYDEKIFGIYSWFTYAVFFLSLAFTGYMVLKLMTQPSTGATLRYAIPATMVLWNDVEIMAKWRYFKEPWLILEPLNALIFFGGLILGTILVLRGIRKQHQSESTASRLLRPGNE